MLHCLNLCPKRQPEAQLTQVLVIHIRNQKTRCDNRNWMVIYFIQKDRKPELENVTTVSLPFPFVFMIYHHPIISLSLV